MNVDNFAISGSKLFLLEDNLTSFHVFNTKPEPRHTDDTPGSFSPPAPPIVGETPPERRTEHHVSEISKWECPFPVRQFWAVRNGGGLIGLLGDEKVGLASAKGVELIKNRPEGIEDGAVGQGVINGRPYIAINTRNCLHVLTCMRERGQFAENALDNKAHHILPLCIDSRGYFASCSENTVQVIDPIGNQVRGDWVGQIEYNMERMDFVRNCGDVISGFLTHHNTGMPEIFFVVQLGRNWQRPVQRRWTLESGEEPVTPPAIFGRNVFTVTKQGRIMKLNRYDLLKKSSR